VVEFEQEIRVVGSGTALSPKWQSERAIFVEVKVEFADLADVVRSAGGGDPVNSLPDVLRDELNEMVANPAGPGAGGQGVGQPARDAPERAKSFEDVKAGPLAPRRFMGQAEVDPFMIDDFRCWGVDE
ncbi:unnamed protein product, partial [Prorocentrum cordatum]